MLWWCSIHSITKCPKCLSLENSFCFSKIIALNRKGEDCISGTPVPTKVVVPPRPSNKIRLDYINMDDSFIGRTDVEAETPILWPPDVKSWLIWKDPDAGKDWGQEDTKTTEDEMVGWHHWLNGHGFWWTPAVGDGQGGLACCGSWGHKESDTTERLNWTSTWDIPDVLSLMDFQTEVVC